MKQILSQNFGLIGSDIINHPTTIFTNDNVEVNVFATEQLLNFHLANMANTSLPPLPAVGQWCEKNVVYAYGANKAKCNQSHYRMNYTPEETPALFNVIVTTVGYPVWKQPAGAHDSYKIGDRVHFPLISSPVYESKINANVWSPTGYPAGWQLIP